MGSLPDKVTRAALAVVMGAAVCAASAPSFAGGGGGSGGDALAPGKMASGPSLLETGKISPPKLEGDAPTKTLRAGPKLKARPEPKVPKDGDAPATTPTAPPAKVTLSAAAQRQITARLRELTECRARVARDKHVRAADVRAGALLLRWTIGLDGSVSDTEVVEKTPVDPTVLECVRETIAKWTFPVPDNGPVPVERRYRFHAAR